MSTVIGEQPEADSLQRQLANFNRSVNSLSAKSGVPINLPFVPGPKLSKFAAKLAQVSGGTSDARIMMYGDSTTAGAGAGIGTSTDGAFARNTAAQLAPTLATLLKVPVRFDCFPGTQNYTVASQLQLYDPRLTTIGANWSLPQGGVNGLAAFGLSYDGTAVNPVQFRPSTIFDTIVIYWTATNTVAGAVWNIAVDGVGVGSISVNQASDIYKQTILCPRGAHTITVTPNTISATGWLNAIEVFDSTVRCVQIITAGWSGGQSSNLASTSAQWRPLKIVEQMAPDLTILNIGINDANAGVAVGAVGTAGTYIDNIDIIVSGLQLSGDVILVNANDTVGLAASPSIYWAALRTYAASKLLPVFDTNALLWGLEAQAAAQGFMYSDSVHPSFLGYTSEAAQYANYIASRV